jgi:hypothetical protein
MVGKIPACRFGLFDGSNVQIQAQYLAMLFNNHSLRNLYDTGSAVIVKISDID